MWGRWGLRVTAIAFSGSHDERRCEPTAEPQLSLETPGRLNKAIILLNPLSLSEKAPVPSANHMYSEREKKRGENVNAGKMALRNPNRPPIPSQ